ncbi:LysM peptidoglycan-binding domain-containing protein [Pseudoglutamicibacter cumminsii]|uniref:Lytic transglycosylase n=1 Tax=Pseudoglutamicibacter cumminsii TaxID=156979 RepID=A0ABX5L6Q3_9MICC|nr:lytic transglycosylase domain-containing protein [Pseudoglutamicibacter cumminsii]MDK7082353.1 LysM peptidoglycan-binding domain-containing protein [Pseudoglutamicibacter cumminsii]PWI27360.1 lytic transglycosylase [Pseudoglutamicibacter cumminsii]
MAPTPPRRTTVNGAIATAALPIITLSTLGSLAGTANASNIPATKPTLRPAATPTPSNVADAKARAAALVAAAKPKAKTVTVKAGDTVWALASRHGVSVEQVLRLNKLKASSLIFPGQKLTLSEGASLPKPTTKKSKPARSASKTSASAKTYTVRSGDTLSGIAAKHGVSLSTLFKANKMNGSTIIYPGQKIKLSGSAAAPARVAAAKPAAKAKAAPKPAAASKTYTVRAGDTLSGIAAKHGLSLSAIFKANNFNGSTIIYPGQKIKLNGTATAAKSAPKVAAQDNSLVSNKFLHYTYDAQTHTNANVSKRTLLSRQVPSPAQMRQIVADTAARHGVDPALALAHAQVESGFDARAVSPANAIGTMQVLPSTAKWMGDRVGRQLDPLDPYDNVTAGVLFIKYLQSNAKNRDEGIAAYYQGLAGVQNNGMYPDTKDYVRKVKSHM